MKSVILGKDKFFIIVIIVVITIILLGIMGSAYVRYLVGMAYYPHATQANYGLAYAWVFGLASLIIWLYLVFASWFAKAEHKMKHITISSILLAIIVIGHLIATTIYRDYKVNYYIGKDLYSIPWRYNPYNGDLEPGGDGFVLRIPASEFSNFVVPDLSDARRLRLSKRIENNKEKHPAYILIDDICNNQTCAPVTLPPNSYFIEDGYYYSISGSNAVSDSFYIKDITIFKQQIVDLFNSFKQ